MFKNPIYPGKYKEDTLLGAAIINVLVAFLALLDGEFIFMAVLLVFAYYLYSIVKNDKIKENTIPLIIIATVSFIIQFAFINTFLIVLSFFLKSKKVIN
jgi:hypothetical protein